MAQRTHHTLPEVPLTSLDDYVSAGGLSGLEAARSADPDTTITWIERSGLRGRGGAGFPTGTKWRSVAEIAETTDRVSVVVNAAEGEPGTFKDRALLRTNPFLVLEGAMIAALAVGSPRIVVATKAAYRVEVATVENAVGQLAEA